jgi:class 3 adenylate cyclase/tetratricopeptide (TPR) repeat protein
MVVCWNCGERNPDRARFCWNCGARLTAATRGGEERKVVTVLFCDLVGFTARSDHADPEDVKATLRPYHARMKREIEHFGGTLDKFIGDGALGVFGAPVAHEDDPERAVRSALRIQEAIAELNADDPDLRLAARVGVATGEVVVTFGEGPQIGESVTGDVVNTASRIQSIAQPGGVVVGEVTYRATRNAFDYEALPPVIVKGKDEPLAIWRPLGIQSRYAVAFDPRARQSTPFIGRVEELFLLKATYRRMFREASAQLVTITGEPGVGKSRLIGELFTYVDELPEIVRWRYGRCLPYGDGITFWALGEIVKAQAGILESDQPAEVEAKLERSVAALIPDEQQREWVSARLAGLVGASGGAEPGSVDRPETFTAWRRYIEALASEYPLVLVFEDLHWADGALLGFIDQLIEWAVDLPMLIVCAARPELYERHPGWGGGKLNSTTIQLSPLQERETAMLLSGLLDQAVLPADTQGVLLARAGGNPLYAEEFARMLTDGGWLDERGRVAGPGGDGDLAIPVPDSLQALVAARLDTLPAARKELLHDAAVVGTVFWDGPLSSLSDRPVGEVRADLHEMARKELVREAGTSTLQGMGEFSFWHPLIRDVAYGQIPRSARGAKHRAFAAWIERSSGDRLGDRAEVLAHHYETALTLARSTGEAVTDDLIDATGRALTLAGDRAMRLDVASAESYYGRALRLLPPGDALRSSALVRLSKAYSISGRYARAAQIATEAVDGYRAAGDMVGVGEATAMVAGAMSKVGDTARSEALLEEAREILEGEPPGRELTRVYNRLAGQRLVSGRFAESRDFARKALDMATDLGAPDEAVRARQFLGAARCDLGDAGGLEDLWEALRAGLDLGLGEETALCYGNLAYQLWLREGPEVARQVWSASIEFSEVRGFASHAMWARAGMLEVLFDLGDWDQVLAIADRMAEWDEAGGLGELGVFAAYYRGMVLGYRHDVEEAADLERTFLPAAREIAHPEILAPALYAAMVIEAGRGRMDLATDLAREFGVATADHPGFRAHYLPGVLRVMLLAGHADEAASLLVDEAMLTAPRHLHGLASSRAQLEEVRGDQEQAAELFAACAEDWRTFGFALERAHALFGLGRCLSAIGRPNDATPPLLEARSTFAGLGARGLVARVDERIGQLTALTS